MFYGWMLYLCICTSVVRHILLRVNHGFKILDIIRRKLCDTCNVLSFFKAQILDEKKNLPM